MPAAATRAPNGSVYIDFRRFRYCEQRSQRVLTEDWVEPRTSREPASTRSKEFSPRSCFSFPSPSRMIFQIVGPCVGLCHLGLWVVQHIYLFPLSPYIAMGGILRSCVPCVYAWIIDIFVETFSCRLWDPLYPPSPLSSLASTNAFVSPSLTPNTSGGVRDDCGRRGSGERSWRRRGRQRERKRER